MSLANLRKAFIGSEPVERMNMRGVVGPTSEYRVLRSIDGLSTNVLPRFSQTKSTAANTTYGIITQNAKNCH